MLHTSMTTLAGLGGWGGGGRDIWFFFFLKNFSSFVYNYTKKENI